MGATALHWSARRKRNEVMMIILDSVSEEERHQILSITDSWSRTPLHISCEKGDAESVRVMLNHINQDMRYSLLQMTEEYGYTPLLITSFYGHTDIMNVIHDSVTQTQWISLLQIQGYLDRTVLQRAAYRVNDQSSIDTIRNSVSDEEWLQLLCTPLPEYIQQSPNNKSHQRAVNRINELRAAARVKSVLQTENNSGM